MVAVSVVAIGSPPSAAAAKLNWSTARLIDTAPGVSLTAVTCSSAALCEGIDSAGRLVRFSPRSPARATPIDLHDTGLVDLACPSATQCSAVDQHGGVVTFNPGDPGTIAPPPPVQVDHNIVAGGRSTPWVARIVCAATVQCVIVDSTGAAVVFNPTDPAQSTSVALDPGEQNGLVSVACPTTNQCTAVGEADAVTFDPAAPAPATPVRVAPARYPTPVRGGFVIARLACSSTTQCTAIDSFGHELTFNPQQPATAKPALVDTQLASDVGLQCPSTTECVELTLEGAEVTFNPHSRATTRTVLEHPRATLFTPIGAQPEQLACVSAALCVAVDAAGRALSFDPVAPSKIRAGLVDPGEAIGGITCHTRTECVVLAGRQAGTFDPSSRATPRYRTLISAAGTYVAGIQCPARSLCVAVQGGQAGTWDPRRQSRHHVWTLATGNAASFTDLRCRSARECVAVNSHGQAVSFNPTTRRFIRRTFTVRSQAYFVTLACPSATQCTAVDHSGQIATFQPRTGHLDAHGYIDGHVQDLSGAPSQYSISGISCAATRLCVTVDSDGNLVRFDPRTPGSARLVSIERGAGRALEGIACPSSRECVFGDQAGRILTGDPHAKTFTATQLSVAAPITAIACVRNTTACVATNATGDAFTTLSHP